MFSDCLDGGAVGGILIVEAIRHAGMIALSNIFINFILHVFGLRLREFHYKEAIVENSTQVRNQKDRQS